MSFFCQTDFVTWNPLSDSHHSLLRQILNASIAKIPSAQPTNLCALEGLRWLLTRLEDTPGLLFSVTEKLPSCSPCPATLGSQHTLSLLRRKPCIPQVSVLSLSSACFHNLLSIRKCLLKSCFLLGYSHHPFCLICILTDHSQSA